MAEENQGHVSDVQKAEIDRLIDDFREKFKERTTDTSDYITIHEIERMWGELLGNTQNVYSDMIRELISAQDEKELIRQKKGVQAERGEAAHTYEAAAIGDLRARRAILHAVLPEATGQGKQGQAHGTDRS